MVDKRQFPRVDDNAELRWRIADDAPPDPHEAGIQTSISGGGIRFQTLEAVAVGNMLALQLRLPGFPSAVIALARVAWCEPTRSPRNGLFRLKKADKDAQTAFEVGCEFHWVGWDSNAAQEAVMSYVKDKLAV